MRLYLVQHGEALPEGVDSARPLSEKGRADVSLLGGFLQRAGVQVIEIQHSGKQRAVETAEILAAAFITSQVSVRRAINPNDPVAAFVSEMRETKDDLLVVGHLPFLGRAASLLLAGVENLPLIAFEPGGMACLSRADDGRWSLSWMVVPSLFRSPRGGQP